MQKYVCEPCGYVYDPEVGDPITELHREQLLEGTFRRLGMPDLRYGKRSIRSRIIEMKRKRRQTGPGQMPCVTAVFSFFYASVFSSSSLIRSKGAGPISRTNL